MSASEVNADNNNRASKVKKVNKVKRASKVKKVNRVKRASAASRANRVKVNKANKGRDNQDNSKVNNKAVNNNNPAAHRMAAPIAAVASTLAHSGDQRAVTGATIDNSPPKSVNDSARLRICDASGAQPDLAPAVSMK